jgi:glycosyltransferase involved in cell wall biosynthesis
VCVVPIRQGSGTRLKILEAMALGVPVVSTSKGAEGLDVVDGQHLLIADDPAEFVVKTRSALHNTVLRERLIAQARQLVEQRYDWRTIGQQFVNLVESTIVSADHG